MNSFRPLSHCHYSTLGTVLAFQGEGMDLYKAVAPNQGRCHNPTAHLTISGTFWVVTA